MSGTNQRWSSQEHDDAIAVISDYNARSDDHGGGETSRLNNEPSYNGVRGGGSGGERKPMVHMREPAVSETRGYEVVKIVEKQGVFHSAIPVMPLPLAVIFCLFNIVLPGTGESLQRACANILA